MQELRPKVRGRLYRSTADSCALSVLVHTTPPHVSMGCGAPDGLHEMHFRPCAASNVLHERFRAHYAFDSPCLFSLMHSIHEDIC